MVTAFQSLAKKVIMKSTTFRTLKVFVAWRVEQACTNFEDFCSLTLQNVEKYLYIHHI
jgi:hypothetical protein